MLLDVDYILIGMPGLLTAVWAWRKRATAGARAAREASATGLTGEEAARCVLRASGLADVPIEEASGPLADHYEAGARRLRLSDRVSGGRSRAAVATAVHEAGHAVQERARSPWTLLRKACVPLADLGSILAWILIAAGVALGVFRLTIAGLAVVSLAVMLQLLNVGAEIDASRRGMKALEDSVAVTGEERAALAHAFGAAEWTHVASVLTGFPAFLAHCVSGRPDHRRGER